MIGQRQVSKEKTAQPQLFRRLDARMQKRRELKFASPVCMPESGRRKSDKIGSTGAFGANHRASSFGPVGACTAWAALSSLGRVIHTRKPGHCHAVEDEAAHRLKAMLS
jgi:hypothetical protein